MQWTIGKKLYTAIGVLAVSAIAMIAGSTYTQSGLGTNVEDLAQRAAPNVARAQEMEYLVEFYRSTNRHNVILSTQRDAAGIEKNRATLVEIAAKFREQADGIRQNTRMQEVLAILDSADKDMKELEVAVGHIADLSAEFKTNEAVAALSDAAAVANRVQEDTGKIVELQNARFKAVSADADSNQRAGTTTMMVLALLVFGVLAVAAWVIRGIVNVLTMTVNTLKSGAEQVTAASTQVASSAQALSQGSTEQAASLEETSASMEEMSSMTSRNADNSAQAAQFMGDVDRVVLHANKALEQMTHSMATITESSNKVSKIIKTIDEIAFQTNILALNAAVEAARAGEAGMGFAVVADEVRNLAQRSAQAAKDTAVLIEDAITSSQQGNSTVTLVGSSIAEITTNVAKVRGLVSEVSEASQQQSSGIQQVAQAISQMEKVTQSTAATAEESAAASEELSSQAETTMAEVARLEAMVVGTRSNVLTHAPKASKRTAAPAPMAQMAQMPAQNRASKLLKLPTKAAKKMTPAEQAEAEFPMNDTGTFGKF